MPEVRPPSSPWKQAREVLCEIARYIEDEAAEVRDASDPDLSEPEAQAWLAGYRAAIRDVVGELREPSR